MNQVASTAKPCQPKFWRSSRTQSNPYAATTKNATGCPAKTPRVVSACLINSIALLPTTKGPQAPTWQIEGGSNLGTIWHAGPQQDCSRVTWTGVVQANRACRPCGDRRERQPSV